MSDKTPQDSKRLRVFYQNGPFHRTVFVGGAWAGVSPNGLVQVGTFNDLRPMPEMVVHGVVDDSLGPEIEKLEKQGVVREVEATFIDAFNHSKVSTPANTANDRSNRGYTGRAKNTG